MDAQIACLRGHMGHRPIFYGAHMVLTDTKLQRLQARE